MSYHVYTKNPESNEPMKVGQYEDEGVARGAAELLLQQNNVETYIEVDILGGVQKMAEYKLPESTTIPEPTPETPAP